MIDAMTTEPVELPSVGTRAFGGDRNEIAHNISLQLAIDLWRDGKWSTGKAARSAGMKLINFMDLLMERKVQHPFTVEMLEDELRHTFGDEEYERRKAAREAGENK
ncbi:MAG: putative HTH domain antitoxin [Limisphaerales bacterium]